MVKRFRTITLAILLLAATAAAQSPPAQSAEVKPLALTLAECIERALKSNLDLSIEAINPAMAEEARRGTKDQFLPQFDATSQYGNQKIPSTWGVEGPTVLTKRDYFNFGLSQHLVTGTDLTLSAYSQRTDTTRAYTTVNPSYYSELRFSLAQKLLKGFGPAINRYETTKAERQFDQSVEILKAAVLTTVYSVEEAYWNLVYARESLRVLEASLVQSRDTLARNVEAARIGSKSAVDVLSAETEVASRETALLSARASLEKMENRLKSLLNLPVETGEGEAETRVPIIPADRPTAERRTVPLDEAMRAARAERPEIAQAESRIADAALDVRYNRNQLLPDLQLRFSIWNPGQSGIKYIFQDNNPLSGIILDKIVGGRMDSFRDLIKQNYRNVSFDLSLTIPLGSLFSRASLARARLAEDQARLSLERARKNLEVEVLEAVKDLDVAGRKIEASARYRELMEKRVEAESQKYQMGLVGSEWLFSYQRSLDQAKADEIQAVTGYRIAQARLEKAMGTTIKSKGLKFRGYEF
ncbi:MAG: TolC family protein [Candidatus Aminicenantes bacterium]|nr:TolC family protein [Candidatus Aminicenantes bacterium]